MGSSSKLQKAVNVGIIALVVLVVLFETYAVVVPTAGAASDDLNDSNTCVSNGGLWCGNLTPISCYASGEGCNSSATPQYYQQVPLGNLFNTTGFIYILVMVGLLLFAIRGFMPKRK